MVSADPLGELNLLPRRLDSSCLWRGNDASPVGKWLIGSEPSSFLLPEGLLQPDALALLQPPNKVPLEAHCGTDHSVTLKKGARLVECCNTPHVTCHICNSDSCHFRLCVMIFPLWSGFVFRFAFCHVMHFHIMSSCALHSHTCSSHASEHFPRCPFCNPALLSPPAHPSCFLSCAGVKLSRNGPRLVKWP